MEKGNRMSDNIDYSMEAFKMFIGKASLLFYSRDYYQPSEAMVKACKMKRTITRGNIISVLVPCQS
jgi:hypothetical protein